MNNFINHEARIRVYKKYTKKKITKYKKILFSTKDIQSCIQPGTTWAHQK